MVEMVCESSADGLMPREKQLRQDGIRDSRRPGVESVQADRRMPRGVLLVVGLGVFLAQLDGTVMNVALPSLARAFHAGGLSTVQPVITAYLVAGIALLPLLGKLADRWGRKRLFVAGFALFGCASLACALATSLAMLVLLRIVQACGGALLSGTGLALVAANSGHRRGQSLGRLTVVFALSGLIGPPLGGGLVQAFGWRAVFWPNIPLAAAGILLGLRLLPPDAPRPVALRLDLIGAALFAGGSALITAASSEAGGQTLGRFTPAWPFLVGLGLLAYLALLRWEQDAPRRGIDPVLDRRLLRRPGFGIGLVAAFLSNGVTIALFVLVPYWLSKGWHVAPATLGAVFLPVAIGLGGLAPVAGSRSDRIGTRRLTTAGMAVAGLAALALAWQATNLIWPMVIVAMLGLGAGSGLFAAPNNNAVLSAVPDEALAVAGSMLSAARTLGVILGVGASGALFDALRASAHPNSAARVLFLLAAALFAGNAILCWTARGSREAAAVVAMSSSNNAAPGKSEMPAAGRLHRAQ
jgi:MFS family permease